MYIIYIRTPNKSWNDVVEIDGCEAAYNAFRKACDFAETFGGSVALVWSETGEIIADSDEED